MINKANLAPLVACIMLLVVQCHYIQTWQFISEPANRNIFIKGRKSTLLNESITHEFDLNRYDFTAATCYLIWNNEWLTISRNGFNISPSFLFDNSDVVACDSLLHMRNDYIQKKVDAHKVTYHNQYHDFQHCLFDSWRFIIWTTSGAFSIWDTTIILL